MGVTLKEEKKSGNFPLLAPPKTGVEFLSSSHMKISQDARSVNGSLYNSTFKQDYIPHVQYGKLSPHKPSQPADVMHKDARFFNDNRSVTVTTFLPRFALRSTLTGTPKQLQSTNFKMDRDTSKFNSFDTTHDSYFTPKDFDRNPAVRGRDMKMNEHIIVADREKEMNPKSDYRRFFKGHDTNSVRVNRIIKGSGPKGSTTIKGDKRLHGFDTTQEEHFTGQSQYRVKCLPAPGAGSNIPTGDETRFPSETTTHHDSFAEIKFEPFKYLKSDICGKLQKTNFRLTDHHTDNHAYNSTHGVSYTVKNLPVSRSAPAYHRNHSDLPKGDVSQGRNVDRLSMTTNRYYHGKAINFPKPTIVSGAEKRVFSKVVLGEPRLGSQFYDTTVDTTFTPLTLPDIIPQRHHRSYTSVPLSYYGRELTEPTSREDFKDPKQGKMIPNPAAISKLKDSHILPPVSNNYLFSTEHIEQFTPKSSKRYEIDGGKLQRSSVPLGTMIIKAN
ncbi:stabilizer of axonemal microtubules 5-like [Tubulanus polymorphus]|uniref:stabilizer of axonemal microtubules 5-like n=1 Tax=Tubulanus polymorphus TaxID=672921 RepID=UPI003DA4244D